MWKLFLSSRQIHLRQWNGSSISWSHWNWFVRGFTMWICRKIWLKLLSHDNLSAKSRRYDFPQFSFYSLVVMVALRKFPKLLSDFTAFWRLLRRINVWETLRRCDWIHKSTRCFTLINCAFFRIANEPIIQKAFEWIFRYPHKRPQEGHNFTNLIAFKVVPFSFRFIFPFFRYHFAR